MTRRLLLLAVVTGALVAALCSPPVRAQVAGLAWQLAGVAIAPVRTVNVASGGAFNAGTGTLTLTGGGGGSSAYTIDVANLYAAFSVIDSTFNETHGQMVALDANGTATGVKFAWPGGAALGPVRVGMWTYPAGVLVGSNTAPFAVLAQGVYTVNFDTPVAVSAFRQYIVGVWRSDGAAHSTRYATTPSWLAPPNNSAGATVEWTGIAHSFGGAWYYAGGAGVFPSVQITSEAYPVQMIFTVP